MRLDSYRAALHNAGMNSKEFFLKAVLAALLFASAAMLIFHFSIKLVGVHGDLAGGIFGGVGTVFAGWLAWRAVREQIDEQRLVAAKPEAQLLEGLAAEIPYKGEMMRTSPSIGVAVYPRHAEGQDELYKAADLALYEAKRAGRNTWRLYEASAEGERRADVL